MRYQKQTKALWSFLTSCIVLSLLLSLTSCSEPDTGAQNSEKKSEGRTVAVSVADVSKADVPVTLTAVGNVEPYAAVAVKPQVTGILQEVTFREGEPVKKGEILFSIDKRPFAARVAQAQAALAKDQAALANARRQAQRYQNAVANGYVSSEQADQAQTSVATLEATLLADEAALTSARIDLENCLIRAPISGYTGALMVDQGNLVKASSDQVLVTINQLTPVKVSFTLPEQHLAEIRKRIASQELTPLILNPQETAQTLTGKISFFDNAVDPQTGTIRLKADFPNRHQELWPGQFLTVNIRLTILKDVTVVPARAAQSGLEGNYAFIINADQKAELRQLDIAYSNQEWAVISAGLQVGDVVVTDGQLRLRAGATVSIIQEELNGSPL